MKVRMVAFLVASLSLSLAACDGGSGDSLADRSPSSGAPSPTESKSRSPEVEDEPLTLDEIEGADEGAVTLDVLNHPDTSQARYVEAVYDEAGDITPLGLTDKNLILYGLRACARPTADLDKIAPPEWEEPPGDELLSLFTFKLVAATHALRILC